ncbi:MAG: TRAP transporter substrate-binding protein [Pseudomonadota bacterium]
MREAETKEETMLKSNPIDVACRSARVSRRGLIAGSARFAAGAAAAAIVGAPAIVRAQAAKRFLRPLVAGLNAREGDPSFESIARIARILREKYDVQMEIQVHPSSVLGTDVQQLEAVQTGFIDITSNVTAQFSGFSDAFAFVDLPYALTNWDMYQRLAKSELWKRQAAKFEERVPLKVLPPVGAGGFRLLWNSKRATPAPAAVNGLKYRTTNSQLEIALVRAWGGNPTPMAWTETYNALKSGVLEGMHVQPIWTFRFNMHEVLKYATEVDAIFAVQFQVMNANTWRSMPPEMQRAFMLAAQEATDQANDIDRQAELTFKTRLKEARMEIYTPSAAEKQQWQRAGEQIWATAGASIDRAVINEMVTLR